MFVFPFIEDDKGQENTYKGLVSLGNRLKMEHESWIKEMIKRKYRLERYEKLNIDPATISKQFTGEKVCNRTMPLKNRSSSRWSKKVIIENIEKKICEIELLLLI